MFETQLAYRHDNGEVEGFVGFGFSPEMSRGRAIREVVKKVEGIGKKYVANQLIEKGKGLSPEELAVVHDHWGISAPPVY